MEWQKDFKYWQPISLLPLLAIPPNLARYAASRVNLLASFEAPRLNSFPP